MDFTRTPHPDAALDEVVTALRGGDFARADRAVAARPDAIPADAMLCLAELNMRRRRWRAAAWLFDRVPNPPAAVALKRRLCGNLAALEAHRPGVYAQLVDLPAQDAVSIGASATGRPTLFCRRDDGAVVGMSPGNEPIAAMSAAMATLRPAIEAGQSVALCGLGDGYVLHALAADATTRFLGMEQPVFVIEPDAQIALHGLMIHDYTGPAGPIEQRRFAWFVDPGWADALDRLALDDPFAGIPSLILGLGMDAATMKDRITKVGERIVERDREAAARIDQYYETISAGSLAELFGPTPPRRPRVLLLTTRFSTVLQYSTADTAEAFGQLGWDARVLIEPSPAHRLFRNGIRQALDEFRPDLVFQIDHLRAEHRGLFPPNLPFACWVQDHLSNLKDDAAGRSVGPRDFVLTDAAPHYVQHHAYPARQAVALSKLTRVSDGRVASDDAGNRSPMGVDDLVFVSNASHDPVALVSELASVVEGPPAVVVLAERCGREILAVYAAGGCLPAFGHVRDLVRRVARNAGIALTDPSIQALASRLMHPLNDALYRQQALGWAAGVADELGLTLALYGRGWDAHPTLARFARGPVQYGAPLEELTWRSRINLQVVPYGCLHQRLLDGLVAGGFFLVRANPADTEPRALLDFLDRHTGGDDGQSCAAIRAGLPPGLRGEFDARAAAAGRFLCSFEDEDPVAYVRWFRRAELLRGGRGVLPRYADVAFHDRASLGRLVRRFAENPEDRGTIAAEQRADVVARFGYTEGMRRVVAQIHARLAEEGSLRRARPVRREAA